MRIRRLSWPMEKMRVSVSRVLLISISCRILPALSTHLTQAILLDDTFFPAYFMRSLVRYKQLEYQRAEAGATDSSPLSNSTAAKPEVGAVDYERGSERFG